MYDWLTSYVSPSPCLDNSLKKTTFLWYSFKKAWLCFSCLLYPSTFLYIHSINSWKLYIETPNKKDEMAWWHHQLNGHEFVWTPGVGDGQGGLACCNLWGRKESDMAERLNWTDAFIKDIFLLEFYSKASCSTKNSVVRK